MMRPTATTFLMTAVALPLMLLMAACDDNGSMRQPPAAPTPPDPPATPVTVTAYILPDAGKWGAFAFGDEDLVVYKGERFHWVNADGEVHSIVADDPNATDFVKTDRLSTGGQTPLVTMTKLGRTGVHCEIHLQETGTLVVREH